MCKICSVGTPLLVCFISDLYIWVTLDIERPMDSGISDYFSFCATNRYCNCCEKQKSEWETAEIFCLVRIRFVSLQYNRRTITYLYASIRLFSERFSQNSLTNVFNLFKYLRVLIAEFHYEKLFFEMIITVEPP